MQCIWGPVARWRCSSIPGKTKGLLTPWRCLQAAVRRQPPVKATPGIVWAPFHTFLDRPPSHIPFKALGPTHLSQSTCDLELPILTPFPIHTEPTDRDPAAGPALLNNQAEKAAYSTAGYASHSHSPSDGQGGSRTSPVATVHPIHPAPHGYNHAPPGPSDAHIHPELRSASDPAAPPNSAYPPVPASSIMGAQHQPNNHHIIPGPLAPMGGSPEPMDMSGDGMQDGRGNKKRELSTSKRAAQNRAAQVSFPISRTSHCCSRADSPLITHITPLRQYCLGNPTRTDFCATQFRASPKAMSYILDTQS